MNYSNYNYFPKVSDLDFSVQMEIKVLEGVNYDII